MLFYKTLALRRTWTPPDISTRFANCSNSATSSTSRKDSSTAPTSVTAAGRHVVVNKSAGAVDVSDAAVFG